MSSAAIAASPAVTWAQKTWSRSEVASGILEGDSLVIFEGHLLRISPSWLSSHPGGPLAILHFVGRDATDEILAYHADETLKKIRRFIIGAVDCGPHGWVPFLPPIMSGWVRKRGEHGGLEWFREATAVRSEGHSEQSPSSQVLLVKRNARDDSEPTLETITPSPTDLSLEIQTRHSAAYKALHQKIIDSGLYETPYLSGYGPEVARYTLLASLSVLAYQKGWFITSAFFLGLTWHQLVFSAHDLGHMGVTHNWAVDRILGILIADFIGGLSIGWWVEVSFQCFER